MVHKTNWAQIAAENEKAELPTQTTHRHLTSISGVARTYMGEDNDVFLPYLQVFLLF